MSPQIVDKPGYCDAIAAEMQKGEWVTIDGLCDAVLPYVDDNSVKQLVRAAVKAKIRNDLKAGKITTADGRRIKAANVVVKDKNGNLQQVYKDETLLDVGDCVQVVRYWRSRRNYAVRRIRYYTKLAVTLHGSQITGLLPLRD